MIRLFHPLLTLITSTTDRELARYVQFLKEENKILRARIPGQVHTKPAERQRLIEFGKVLGEAVEELITIVSPSTFYRWVRDEKAGKKQPNPKGGQRKPRELRELVIEITKTTRLPIPSDRNLALATPEGISEWQGDSLICLDQGRYFVVIGALCEGHFAVFDTDTSALIPFRTDTSME